MGAVAAAVVESGNITAEEISALTVAVLQAKERAYCPYSHFRVGAVLLTTSTSHPHVAGANVENAAYPSGFCAERAAIGAAIGGLGMRRGEIRAVAVATDLVAAEQGDGEENLEGFASPCGMCRQVLREFCDLTTPIYMHDAKGRYVTKTLGELLPMSFGPDTLPPPHALPTQEPRQSGAAAVKMRGMASAVKHRNVGWASSRGLDRPASCTSKGVSLMMGRHVALNFGYTSLIPRTKGRSCLPSLIDFEILEASGLACEAE